MAHVTLVPFTRDYLDHSWRWLNDPEVKELTLVGDFSRQDQLDFFDSLPSRDDYKIWGVEADGQPVGAGGIKNIRGNFGEFWCYIGERDWWGRGIGGRILELCEEKARELGVERLSMVAADTNERSIRAFEKMGFVRSVDQPKAGMVELIKEVSG